jgi:NDP-mannose synthase
MHKDLNCKDIRAVILAGGKGTRLRPLTAVFPKPLVPLDDKPILEILLSRLKSFQFNKITLCTGYMAEMIMMFCEDRKKFGLDISFSREESPLGTVGPLGTIENLTDPFIVMNGDLLTTLNLDKMLSFHQKQNADLTLGVYQRDVKIDFGVVESNQNDEFTGFKEKPVYHFEVSMGINILSKSVMKYVKPGVYLDMPDLIMKVHENGGRVCCYREDCFWLDIGRMDDYALAQEHFVKNKEMLMGALAPGKE